MLVDPSPRRSRRALPRRPPRTCTSAPCRATTARRLSGVCPPRRRTSAFVQGHGGAPAIVRRRRRHRRRRRRRCRRHRPLRHGPARHRQARHRQARRRQVPTPSSLPHLRRPWHEVLAARTSGGGCTCTRTHTHTRMHTHMHMHVAPAHAHAPSAPGSSSTLHRSRPAAARVPPAAPAVPPLKPGARSPSALSPRRCALPQPAGGADG